MRTLSFLILLLGLLLGAGTGKKTLVSRWTCRGQGSQHFSEQKANRGIDTENKSERKFQRDSHRFTLLG
jgi:hypothetical protein